MSGALDLEEVSPETRIVFRPKLPPAESVLVDTAWVNALTAIEERVAAHKITDGASAQVAADLQRRVTTAKKDLDAARKAIKEPFLEASRAVDEAARGPMSRIDTLLVSLKTSITVFTDAEAERVRQAELDRQREIRRLEREAQLERDRIAAEAERVAKVAREAAAAAEVERKRVEAENEKARAAGEKVPLDLGLDDDEPALPPEPPPPPQKSDAEIRLEQARHAPVPVAAKILGSAMRVTLEVQEVDVAQLPDPFVIKSANFAEIRRVYCVGYKENDPMPEVPGVTFSVRKQPVSTKQRI